MFDPIMSKLGVLLFNLKHFRFVDLLVVYQIFCFIPTSFFFLSLILFGCNSLCECANPYMLRICLATRVICRDEYLIDLLLGQYK